MTASSPAPILKFRSEESPARDEETDLLISTTAQALRGLGVTTDAVLDALDGRCLLREELALDPSAFVAPGASTQRSFLLGDSTLLGEADAVAPADWLGTDLGGRGCATTLGW